MQKRRLLFADNDPDFLDTRAEFLEIAGYAVLKARSPEQVRQLLADAYIHIAILDIRLVDDDDEQDTSGLSLAKDPAFTLIPKIILTGFPTYRAVREVLGPVVDGMPAAVNFLAKEEGPDVMIQAIEQSFAKHIRLNQSLKVRWQEAYSFPHLHKLIEPQATDDDMVGRLLELEDLFRGLFFTSTQIIFGQLIARGQGTIIMSIFTYEAPGRERQYIVACGQRAQIRQESNNFATFAPTKRESTGTVKELLMETIHFAAIAYQLIGGDLEEISTFRTCYRNNPAHVVKAALDYLYKITLAPWYEKGRFRPQEKGLQEFYQEWLNLHDDQLSSEKLLKCVKAICEQVLTTGLATLIYTNGNLILTLADNTTVAYPDPIRQLNHLLLDQPTLYGISHAHVNPDTILIDPQKRTWLVDFAHVSPGPLLRDFISLEAALKFELTDPNDLFARHELEQRLLTAMQLDSSIDVAGLPPGLEKPLGTVQHIRQLAAQIVGPNPKPYWAGLFFCALKRMTAFDPELRYTRRELIPVAHSLLAAAMLFAQLREANAIAPMPPDQAYQSLWIDEINKETWVEGQWIKLTPQEFEILFYLYSRAGQLCMRQEIVENVLGGEYQEEVERGRLNSAMSRLCQKIEPNTEQYRYIETVRGQGYRLNL